MEQTNGFTDMLFKAISERQQMFDSFLLPKLQEEYRIAHSATKTIRTVLVRKGILHDDPYNYDNKIGEIEIPGEESFMEAEKANVIGQRIAQYESTLDFMNNYYQFTCDYLTTDRIAKLVSFNRCFTWESFSTSSTKVNTKGLADLVNNLRGGADPLSVSIVNDALTQLSRSSIAMTKTLKGLTEFHRERYKIAVRRLVLPGVIIDPSSLATGTSNAIREIKRVFAAAMKDYPFYTELIEEILKEEFSPDHAVLQQELLARLSVTKQNSGGNGSVESFKPLLMDGIRTLGSASPQIDEIIGKLQENQRLALSVEKSFFQKFVRTMRKAFNLPEEEEEIIIMSVDPVTQIGKRESVNFVGFIDDLKHRARILTGFTLRTSTAYQKVEMMEEQQIQDLLTRHVAELGNALKLCAGLDDHFKQSTAPEIRDRIKGIKVEISAIRNNLVKANQCRAEYASQVEEQQQLKKLGITNA